MPKAKQESKTQVMIAVLLGIAGLLILLIFLVIRSQADDATSQATLDNIAPTITQLKVGTTPGGNEVLDHSGTPTVHLVEGTTSTVYFSGTIQDLNGCKEVEDAAQGGDPINVQSIRMGITPPGPASGAWNATSAYYSDIPYTGYCSLSGCTGATDIDVDFLCEQHYQYFADSTTTDTPKGTGEADNWGSMVTTRDYNDMGHAYAYWEMELLTAVDVGASINYGSVSIGERSTTATLQITNTGNDNTTDLDMIGTAMSCTTGTIPVTAQRYATSSAYTGVQLTLTSSTVFDFNLAKQVALWATSTDDTYWTLDVPTPGVGEALSGSCTGTNTIYATAY